MESKCLRCGKCCNSFAVCITPSDMARIAKAMGKEPIEFVDIVPEPPERERKEAAILIDGERSLLVLKRDAFNVCYFYCGDGCMAYESRPRLCRSYPFRVSSTESGLKEMKSRACPERWLSKYEEGRKYIRDCKKYEKEVAAYQRIADKWNAKSGNRVRRKERSAPCSQKSEHVGGNLVQFLEFAMGKAPKL